MSISPSMRFIAKVRRRLWLEALLDRSRAATWAGSLAALALVLASGRWPLSTAVIAISVVLAASIPLLPVMLRRPGVAAAARRADRRLDTHSLLASALEAQSRTGPRTRAAESVIARADAAVPAWRKRLGDTWRAPPAFSVVIAAVPLFVALVLAYRLPDAAPATGEVTTEASVGPSARSLAPAGSASEAVAELRRALDAETRIEPQSASTSAAIVPTDALSVETADTEWSRESMHSLDTPGDGQTRGLEPGVAARSARAQSSGDEPVDFAAQEQVAVQLEPGGARAARTGSEYGDGALQSTTYFPGAIPAAAPPPAAAPTSLTLAELAYARRYLDEAAR